MFSLPMLADAVKNRSAKKNAAAFAIACVFVALYGYNRIHMTNKCDSTNHKFQTDPELLLEINGRNRNVNNCRNLLNIGNRIENHDWQQPSLQIFLNLVVYSSMK